MPGTFFGFNTALRGMQAQQRGIYTTSHNIANANTEGYTRQRVVLAPTPAYPVPGMNHPGGTGWQIGTGVDSQETTRLRDAFLDTQIRRETGSLGQWQQIQDVLQQVEVVFNEPSDTGLSTLFSQFWAAWQELSKNAESSPVRTTVVETANALAEAFRHSAAQLNQIKDDIDQTIELKVKEVNSLAQQIADLNGQIKNIVAAGDQPNDLLDQRDLLLDQLSKIVDFEVEINTVNIGGNDVPDGQIKIKLKNVNLFQNYLVDVEASSNKSIVNKMEAGNRAGEDKWQVYWETQSGTRNEIIFNMGEIKGLQSAYDDAQEYLNNLNTLAETLASEINTQHQSGYNLEGVQGQQFFTYTSGSASQDIQVNSSITNDVSLIAAAKNNPVSDGDGLNALEIAKLQHKLITGLNTSTCDDYYKNFTAKLGVDAHEATRMTTNQGVLVDQLTNRKESISGVSLDEEMANMLQYQRAYEASARMITTLDSMLDKIINGMGVTR